MRPTEARVDRLIGRLIDELVGYIILVGWIPQSVACAVNAGVLRLHKLLTSFCSSAAVFFNDGH